MTLIIWAVCSSIIISVLWISTQSCSALYFGNSLTITKDKQLLSLLGNQIAITQNGNAYVVWVDNNNVYFTSSQENEKKFNSIIALSQGKNLNISPQIAATEKGNVYVLWIEKNSTTGNNNLVFRSSNDGGKNFSDRKELGGIDVLPFSPQIAATQKGKVYVVWIDKNSTTGDSNLVFRSSNDGGKNFSDRKELGGIDVLPFSPQISATEKGNVYIAWVDIDSTTGDSNIQFRSSNDSGDTFAEKKQIRGGKDFSLYPQIAATERGNVYIAWVDIDSTTGDSNIQFRSSNDSGDTFADRKHLRTGRVLSSSPQIAATEKGNVYVVWIDKNSTTGDSNIVFRRSINNGENFESRVHLNKDPSKLSKSFSPQIAATENGKVYVVWIEDDIQFKEILDKDNLFGQTISLNKISNMTSSSSPQIAATENGNVYVVWVNKNNTGISETLLFKRMSQFFFDRNS